MDEEKSFRRRVKSANDATFTKEKFEKELNNLRKEIEELGHDKLKKQLDELKNKVVGAIERNEEEKKELRSEIEDLKKEVQLLKAKKHEDCVKMKKLVEEVKKLELDETDHHTRIASLEKEVFKQDDKLKELRKDIEGSKKREENTRNELMEMKSALQTGQIAFNFERDLATYIYPNGKNIGSIKIFTTMKKWLEKERDTPQGREANEK